MEALIHSYLVSLPTVALFLVIAAALYILGKGADLLVEEAVGLSMRWGVPKSIIGATVVSLGTTLPEASVSVLAALNGNPDLALGNAIGSIIADTGLILGLAALIGTLPIDPVVVKRQGKIQLGAGFLLAIVSIPFFGGNGQVYQWVGWLFVALLGTYIYFSIKWSKTAEIGVAATAEATDIVGQDQSSLLLMLKLLAGVTLVIGSSNVLIPAVEISAIRVGIPQGVIAATLVAFGTSLPELITALTAVRKGHGELAVGNVVGADILNVLFVVGSAAAVTPGGLEVPVSFYKLQIPAMLIILFVFRLFSRGQRGMISKKEGAVLCLLYGVYLILNYTWI